MLIAITVAIAAIALGTALGLLPGSSPRAAGPFRTGAMVTSIAVVLGQLLPESLSHIGMWGLCVFVLGYMAPRAAERLATWLRKPACSHEDAMCTDLGLELGFVGLLLHSVGDGVGLGLYSGPLHAGHGHYDVLFAIAGHTVPVAALVALAFKTHRGTINAIVRAVAVAFAMILGMVLANALSVSVLVRAEPWLTAVVSGLLLHIVTHGWNVEGETTLRSRVGDFIAIGVGIVLVAFGGHGHGHGHGNESAGGDMRHAMGDALIELGLETAPMLLLGLAIAAVLQTQGARIPASVLAGGSRLAQTIRGALVGAPLPVCACGILPVAHGLRKQGATAAFVVTFLLATPELGVDTLALSVRFLGWPLSLARLFGGLAVAMIAGYVLARVAEGAARKEHAREHGHAHAHGLGHEHASAAHAVSESQRPFAAAADARPFARQVLGHFDELLYHVGAWTVVGLLAAAYLQATVSNGSLSMLNIAGVDIALVTVLAVPSYVCAASATPLAAVLLAKGVSQGAVLTGLLLGPATNVATIAWLKGAYGTRATFYGIGALVLTTWTLAGLANVYLPAPVLAIDAAHEHSHGAISYVCAVLLVLLLARAVWRNGLRVWLGSLGEAIGHDHAHGHAHGTREAHDHAH
jgi:uncharacterized membrane protein YraQ (UPF0718 family)